MPFQNASSNFRNVIGVITLITAGEDQIQICASTVDLIATVVGDPTGHVFLWEQIEGSAVVIDDPSVVSTFYTVAGTGDKKFRFWIDKGTASEQFDDITVYDTPINDIESAGFPQQQSITISLDPPPVDCDDIIGTVQAVAPPIAGDHGDQPASTLFTLEWINPVTHLDQFIIQHQVEENTVNVQNTPSTPLDAVATGVAGNGPPPTEPYTYFGGALTTYQIKTLYNIWGKEITAESCIKDFSSLEVPPALAVDDAFDGSVASFPTRQSVSIVRFSTELIQVPNQDIESVSFPTQQSVTTVRFTPTALEVPDQDIESAGFPQMQAASITRFDPSGIGGGGG